MFLREIFLKSYENYLQGIWFPSKSQSCYGHSWQKVPNLYFMKTPTILLTPPFLKFCPTLPLLFFLLPYFFGWMWDHATFSVLFSLIILYLLRSSVFLLFENYSLVEVMYMLIKFNKTKSFLGNTKNTDTNGVNEQNTHSYTERKIAIKRII